MHEQSSDEDWDNFDHTITDEAKVLKRLHSAVREVLPICTMAPPIWDAETYEDGKIAKNACLGKSETGELTGEPCPLLKMCAFTAIVINETYGVWGGLTPHDRRKMRYSKF